MNERFWGIVLAAGKGTRMKSDLPKVLHQVAGKAILYYPVKALLDSGAEGVVVVIGHGGAEVQAYLKAQFDERVLTALQAEQKGTGHAVQCGLSAVPKQTESVFILYGDMPLVEQSCIEALLNRDQTKNYSLSLLSTTTDEPFGYGRMIRSADGSIIEVREERDCSAEEAQINEINPGIYYASHTFLSNALSQIKNDNAQGELLLTDMVNLAAKENGVRDVMWPIEDLHGVNTRFDLAQCEQQKRKRINKAHMLNGVTLLAPQQCYIDSDVSIDSDVTIGPAVVLRGKTRIAKGCIIDAGCVLDSVTLGEGVVLKPYTVASNSELKAQAQAGPFTHLRPGSELDHDARVGNFVEMKKSRLGKGSKASHLSYLGDCVVGQGANIGAGTICCNYDGFNKHQTLIEDGAFIGSDSQLVAPVTVGKNAYVATGTTVTLNVPEDALAIGRSKQQNKEGYAKRLRTHLKAQKDKTGNK